MSSLSQLVTGLAARRAALFGDGSYEVERGGLLLPAARRTKPRAVNLHGSSIQIADEFGEVHNFNTQDYAAMQDELDFVYFSAIHKACGTSSAEEQIEKEEPHLLIRDAELYAAKCTQAYGVPIAVHDPSADLSKDKAMPKKVDTWFRVMKSPTDESKKKKKKCGGDGELTLFEAQQRLKAKKKKKAEDKAEKKGDGKKKGRATDLIDIKETPTQHEDNSSGVLVAEEEAPKEKKPLPLAPGQVTVGKSVENENFFLHHARVSRFAVALRLLPFHLQQRRRLQRMVRLNEAWRAVEGHITGVLSSARFHDVVIMLTNANTSNSFQPSKQETERAWASALQRHDELAGVNDVMEFSSFCVAIDSLGL